MFCQNVVLHDYFVICICPCLVWIDVASVKRYLNATKAAQSALNARKPLVGGREPHLSSRPFRLSNCMRFVFLLYTTAAQERPHDFG